MVSIPISSRIVWKMWVVDTASLMRIPWVCPGKRMIKGTWTTTGLTAGDQLYVSVTPGGATSTAPSGSGDIVRIVGYSISTTKLFFDPDKSYVEIA